MTFRLDGLKDVERMLGDLPKAVARPALIRVGKKRLEPMRDAAKAKASVATGELRDEIIISTRQQTEGSKAKRTADKAAVEITMGPSKHVQQKAVPQEFGSINNPPVGFMRGAWDENSGQLLDNIAEDLGTEVTRAAQRHARRQARAQQG